MTDKPTLTLHNSMNEEPIGQGKPPHRQGPGTYHDPIKKTGRYKTLKEGKVAPAKLSEGRPKGSGRPKVLTPTLITQLAELVSQGCPIEIVRGVCGVTNTTWTRWEKEKDSGDHLAIELFELCEIAECQGNYAWWLKWKTMTEEGDKNWMSAATHLERRLPDLYGRPDRWRSEGGNVPVSASNALHEASNIVLQLTQGEDGVYKLPEEQTTHGVSE